ncbi:hypothetical protein NW759_015195 [Fusarium solani]|nr:hypothetical protein NW759_015195 [Fusarium solani]
MATLVAAAAFGHYGVADRLISEKKVNPDPYVAAVGLETKEEFSTPILAAIGGPNQRVIRLLLSNESFDPTRGFRGKSYAAIAIQRRGPHWQKESHLLCPRVVVAILNNYINKCKCGATNVAG